MAEHSFESTMISVNILQGMDKEHHILPFKSAMNKAGKTGKIRRSSTSNKIKRAIIHQMHDLQGVSDNGRSLSPRDGSGKKGSNFNVLLPLE